YVKFEDADWKLDGTKEMGLYPIARTTRNWRLDKNRRPPKLGVDREQIPLVPAHGPRQPRTAVLLDLNVDSRTHAAYGTVVASRVRSKEDLFLRPFRLWLFQRGAAEGSSASCEVTTLTGTPFTRRAGPEPPARCAKS
ncbi:unnamed protein product, partial [Symbiodinium microadriaticum]